MEENTFKQFLLQAYPYCLPRLNKLTHSKVDSEDVFMEASFQLWQDLQGDKVKNRSNLKALLFVMAKHLYFNQLRKRKSQREYSTDPQQMPTVEQSSRPVADPREVDHLVRAEEAKTQLLAEEKRKKAFRKAMDQLEKNCRELLTKFIVEKQRLKTLQQSLGYSTTDAVKTAKYRCKKKLVNLFKQALQVLPN